MNEIYRRFKATSSLTLPTEDTFNRCHLCLLPILRHYANDPHIHTRWSRSQQKWEVICSPPAGRDPSFNWMKTDRVLGSDRVEALALMNALDRFGGER